jgi:DNA-directed RNA polymerase II subunit RPB2
MTIA